MNTGNRLKQLREAKGLSQAEVAKIIGVGRTTYLKWESGENQPTRKLDQLSRFFNVSIDYLLGKSDVKAIKSKEQHGKGASMEPTLRDGDIVIVKKQPTVDSGDIAIVLVNGNDATVKEIKESPAGITLIGHNAAIYTPQFYSNKEIQNLPIQIIGKVVEMRRKF